MYENKFSYYIFIIQIHNKSFPYKNIFILLSFLAFIISWPLVNVWKIYMLYKNNRMYLPSYHPSVHCDVIITHRRGKKRVTRMVVIVVLAFAICWCPIQVIYQS